MKDTATDKPKAEMLWPLACVLLVAAWVPSEQMGYSAALETGRYAVLAALLIVVIAQSGFLKGLHRLALSGAAGLLLVVIVGYWAVSSMWSDNFIFSAQRSILLLLTVTAIAGAVYKNAAESVLATICAILLVFLLLGAAAAIFIPGLGVENSYFHAGKWKGLTGQKNVFGGLAAIAAAMLTLPSRFLLHPLRTQSARTLAIAFCVFCVAMSQSRGALVDLAIGASIVAMFRIKTGALRACLAFAVLLLPAALLTLLSQYQLDGATLILGGAEFDTSNRITIWSYAFQYWSGRELFGFGYGGFWTGHREDAFLSTHGWVLPNFHSGYIAMIIETGLVGAALFGAFILCLSSRIFVGLKQLQDTGYSGLIALIAIFLVRNVYENTLLRSTDLSFMIFLLASCSIIFATKPAALAGRNAAFRGHASSVNEGRV